MTLPPTVPPDLADALAGNYELLQEIGRGGMGVVYAGRDIRLDRLVAIKVLASLASSGDTRERFLREARASARLSHPSIVPIFSADERNGLTYLVMAYVDGPTLSSRIRDGGALSVDDAIPIIRDIALALEVAHAKGVIHRDIKPENVLIDRASGRAMVTDFGIARLADALQAGALTRTGQVLGTVGYMSPEQVTGSDMDGRSDLYSLGVLAFEALSGHLPFDGPAPVVIVAHATKPAPPLASVAPSVPRAVCEVVDRCLRKNPADRYTGGRALADALEEASGKRVATGQTSVARAGEDRILSEKEAERVWARAAELQEGINPNVPLRAPTAAVTRVPREGEGFRLEHVRAAALEAGISAPYVTLALDELLRRHDAPRAVAHATQGDARATSRPRPTATVVKAGPPAFPLAGAPTQLVYDVDVDGQLSPNDFDVIAHTIRTTMGEAGVATALGRTLSWTPSPSSQSTTRSLHVSVTAAAGRTRIRIEEKVGALAGGIFGGIAGGAGFGLGGFSIAAITQNGGEPLLAAAAAVGVVAAAYGVARAIYTVLVRGKSYQLEDLAQQLATQVSHLIAENDDARTLRGLPPGK